MWRHTAFVTERMDVDLGWDAFLVGGEQWVDLMDVVLMTMMRLLACGDGRLVVKLWYARP